jgi:xylan 1,4-beta-xylosidase
MNDMQEAPVDIATFFSGTTFMWGLFTASGAPQKAYYAFLAEHRLLESPNRIAVTRPTSRDLSAIAGMSDDRTTLRVLLSSLGGSKTALDLQLRNLPWKGGSRYEKQVIDPAHDLETVESGNLQGYSATLKEELDGPSVCLLTIRATQR